MSKLEMQQCVLGQVFTNCYFLKNKETGELLIVDPGDYAEKVFQKVSLIQGKPVGILLTHGHFDHIMAVKEVKEKSDPGLCMQAGRSDAGRAHDKYDCCLWKCLFN